MKVQYTETFKNDVKEFRRDNTIAETMEKFDISVNSVVNWCGKKNKPRKLKTNGNVPRETLNGLASKSGDGKSPIIPVDGLETMLTFVFEFIQQNNLTVAWFNFLAKRVKEKSIGICETGNGKNINAS